MSDYLLDTETLIKRLRYQGRQYQVGQVSRGGSNSVHMLTQAADKIEEQQNQITKLEKVSQAPTDNGIEFLDAICERYNKGEINISQLVCDVWNKALTE